MDAEITSGNHYGRWITIERISKAEAKRRFYNFETIFIKACKMRTFNVWVGMCELSNKGEDIFEDAINHFEYYNCSNETGRYTNFYKKIQ